MRQQIKCGRHQVQLKRADLGIDQVESVMLEQGREIKRHFDLAGVDVDN